MRVRGVGQRRRAERGETSRRRKAREVFDMFDADGSRTISITEMKVRRAERSECFEPSVVQLLGIDVSLR